MADGSILTTPSLVNESGQPLRSDPIATDEQAAQITALKVELESLSKSVTAIASTAKDLAAGSFDAAVADAEQMLKRNVFAAVGIAALIGYLWGRTR